MTTEFGASDSERVYFPSQDSFESGRTSSESLESRFERFFTDVLPDYAGEELFEVNVELSGRVGDPLGFVYAEFNEDATKMKAKIPIASGRNLRGSTSFDDWPTLGGSWGAMYGEYDLGKHRLTVGVGIKALPKGEYLTEKLLGADLGLFFGDGVGLRGSFHILGFGGAGEAAVGWGRGAEMLYDDVSRQIIMGLMEMIHQTTRIRVPIY